MEAIRTVNDICATCSLCDAFMQEQVEDRLLVMEPVGIKPRVLVLDDPMSRESYGKAISIAQMLLGPVEFSYTATIRCNHRSTPLSEKGKEIAASRCAVWTNQLLENRLVFLATKRGLMQLKVGQDKDVGATFKVPRLGIVLCIPPLTTLKDKDVDIYAAKTRRVLREAGLNGDL